MQDKRHALILFETLRMLDSLELPCINGMLGQGLPQAARSCGMSSNSAFVGALRQPEVTGETRGQRPVNERGT